MGFLISASEIEEMILFTHSLHYKIFFLLTVNSSVLGPLLYLHWLSWWPHPVSWPWIFVCWWLPNIISSLISSEAQVYSSSLSQYTINISITDKSWLLVVLLEASGNSIPIAQPPKPWPLSFTTHIQSINKSCCPSFKTYPESGHFSPLFYCCYPNLSH